MENTNEGKATLNQKYFDFKAEVAKHNIIRQMVNIKDIDVVSDKMIMFQGGMFIMHELGFKSLVKLLGFSHAQMRIFDENLGKDVTNELVKMMQISLSKKQDTRMICMVLNGTNGHIINFTKNTQAVMTNSEMMFMFERTMNNNKGMEIRNMSISEEGNIQISVINNNWEFNINKDSGLKDEFFKSGLVFMTAPDYTIIQPFNERLICTNGMINSQKGNALILKDCDPVKKHGFFEAVTTLKGVEFSENDFKERIVTMTKTRASFNELLTCHSSVLNQVKDLQTSVVLNIIEGFLPVAEVKREFLKRGHDLNNYKTDDYKKIRTKLTVWELVNEMTDLSSHPERYGLTLEYGNHSIFALQRTAGDLAFKAKYDLQTILPNVF
jgi:hypothetical protein